MEATMPRTDWRYRDPDATGATRSYAMWTHIVGAIGAIDGIGLIAFIGTLIMWQIKRHDSPFIDDHGREAVNFQISLFIIGLAGIIAMVVFSVVTFGIGAALAVPLALLGGAFLWVLRLVGTIRGAIAANKGEIYRYPMSIRVFPG